YAATLFVVVSSKSFSFCLAGINSSSSRLMPLYRARIFLFCSSLLVERRSCSFIPLFLQIQMPIPCIPFSVRLNSHLFFLPPGLCDAKFPAYRAFQKSLYSVYRCLSKGLSNILLPFPFSQHCLCFAVTAHQY